MYSVLSRESPMPERNIRVSYSGTEVVVTIDIDVVEHEGRGITLSDALIDLAYEVGDVGAI